MIVDFTIVKDELFKKADIILRKEVKKRAPMLNFASRSVIHEGNEASYETVDREKKEVEIKKTASEFVVTREEMAKMKFGDIIEKLCDTAEDIASQMEKSMLEEMEKVTKETGNIIDGKSLPFIESFLKSIEKIQIDFDGSRDKPILPSIVMSPQDFQKVQEAESKMTADEKTDFERRKEEILDKHYEEYQKRRGKRKLIE